MLVIFNFDGKNDMGLEGVRSEETTYSIYLFIFLLNSFHVRET